jgi:hypothetical protein
MTTPHLHVLAIDGTGAIWEPSEDAGVGWCWLTVPRRSIFGDEEGSVTEWDYGIWHGSQPASATNIARKAREVQALDYKTGPALVLDDTAVRICAMLELLKHQQKIGDSVLYFQPRQDALDITDDNLRYLSMYVAHPNICTAVKHGLALLRKAKREPAFAHEMWPYPSNGLP